MTTPRILGDISAPKSKVVTYPVVSRTEATSEVLIRLISLHGPPHYLRSDNGPEFVARAVLRWLLANGIATALIDPGKPWQNGMDESFNGKFRDEFLNLGWFRAQANIIIEILRQHYNQERPHSSLGYLTPHEFKTRGLITATGAVPQ